jgi:hypothetical protein
VASVASVEVRGFHLHFIADPLHFGPDPNLDPACHFDVDPDPDPTFHFDADPDPSFPNKGSKPY